MTGRSLKKRSIPSWLGLSAGAPKGDVKDLPPPREFVEGWSIPKPDVIFTLPKPFSVPDSGVFSNISMSSCPPASPKTSGCSLSEAAPSDRSVVHHIVAYVRRPGSNYFKDREPRNVFFEAPPSKSNASADPGRRSQ